MSAPLSDEITSINAIYTPETLRVVNDTDNVFILCIPNCDISLRIQFPSDYPDHDPPIILGPESSGLETRKGEASEVASIAQDVLQKCFRSSEPCIFDLIEELVPKLQQRRNLAELEQQTQYDLLTTTYDDLADIPIHIQQHQQKPPTEEPQWTLSTTITEKKSVFLARAAPASTLSQAQSAIAHLISTDRKVAKATHNISAWRIHDSTGSSTKNDLPAVVYQDFDDDGETAAGGRLLHLLQLMDVWNIVVVVSRWYGGIQLGPDRFRIINSVAREVVTKGGFGEAGKNKGGARGKEKK